MSQQADVARARSHVELRDNTGLIRDKTRIAFGLLDNGLCHHVVDKHAAQRLRVAIGNTLDE